MQRTKLRGHQSGPESGSTVVGSHEIHQQRGRHACSGVSSVHLPPCECQVFVAGPSAMSATPLSDLHAACSPRHDWLPPCAVLFRRRACSLAGYLAPSATARQHRHGCDASLAARNNYCCYTPGCGEWLALTAALLYSAQARGGWGGVRFFV